MWLLATLAVLGFLFAGADVHAVHGSSPSDDSLSKIRPNPFGCEILDIGTLFFRLWSDLGKDSGSTFMSNIFPTVITSTLLLTIMVIMLTLGLYGTVAQVASCMVNTVVSQLQGMKNNTGFAELIPAVVSAFLCFVIASAFHGAMSPFTVLGFIAVCGPRHESDVPGAPALETGLLDEPAAMETAAAQVRLLKANPFDKFIRTTLENMHRSFTQMVTAPAQILPQLVLLIINTAIFLIWVGLYPLGILLVFSTVLWTILELQYQRVMVLRGSTDDNASVILVLFDLSAAMMPIGAILIVLVPVSCVVLPLFFLGFSVPGAFAEFKKHGNDCNAQGLMWLINIELALMQFFAAILQLNHPVLSLDHDLVLVFTVSIGCFWVLCRGQWESPGFLASACVTGGTSLTSGITLSAVLVGMCGPSTAAELFLSATEVVMIASTAVHFAASLGVILRGAKECCIYCEIITR